MPRTINIGPIPTPPVVVPFGKANQITLYAYDSSSGVWKEVEYLKLEVKDRLSEPVTFYFTTYAVDDTVKSYLKYDTPIVMYIESQFFKRGLISNVKYLSEYEAEVHAFGPEGALLNREFIKKSRHGSQSTSNTTFDSTGKRITFSNFDANIIGTDLLSSNSDSNSPWIIEPYTSSGLFNASDDWYGKDISIRFEHTSRLKGLMGLASSIGYEWWTSYDTDSETTYFHIESSRGSSSPVKTYYISGPNTNCLVTENSVETDEQANRLDFLGYGDGDNQVKTNMYYASDTYSTLADNITSSQSTLEVGDASSFPSKGILKIGDHYVPYASIVSNTFNVVRPEDDIEHKKGVAVFEWYDGSLENHTTLNMSDGLNSTDTTITLTDASAFASSGTIIIGREIITYTGKSGNDLTGCTRGANGTGKLDKDGNIVGYKHNDGEIVFSYDATKHYTDGVISSTSAKADSSISTFGLKDITVTDRTIKDEPTLELAATEELFKYSDPVRRIKLRTAIPFSDIKEVEVGDYITINDSESGLSGNYRVVGITYNDDMGDEYMELEVNNKGITFGDQMASVREKSEKESKYMKGSTAMMTLGPFAENCDSSHPLNLRFFLPSDVILINELKLSFKPQNYRVDSTVSDVDSSKTSTASVSDFASTPKNISSDALTSDTTTIGTITGASSSEMIIEVLAFVDTDNQADNTDYFWYATVYNATDDEYYPKDTGIIVFGSKDDKNTIYTDYESDHTHSHYHGPNEGVIFLTSTFDYTGFNAYSTDDDGDTINSGNDYFLTLDKREDGYQCRYTDTDNTSGSNHRHKVSRGDIIGVVSTNISILKFSIRIPKNTDGKTLKVRLRHNQSGTVPVYSGVNVITIGSHTHDINIGIDEGSGSDASVDVYVRDDDNDDSSEKLVASGLTGERLLSLKDYVSLENNLKNIKLVPNKTCRLEATGFIKCFIESK